MEREKILIHMKDGGLISVDYETNCVNSGCPTCGYGGLWTKEITFEMENSRITVDTKSEYDFNGIDEGELMAVITTNIPIIEEMTEEEFASWVKIEIQDLVNDWGYKDDVEVYFSKRI